MSEIPAVGAVLMKNKKKDIVIQTNNTSLHNEFIVDAWYGSTILGS